MENLNETAARVNRLLNDFEEPIRAMLPQLTRTVKLADELSTRLATPIDQVVPGLTRLADTLNSPVLRALPTDLGQFMEVINDLSRRMSPLAQLAEQAGGLFGLRIPGLSPRPATAPPPRRRPAASRPRPTEPPAAAKRRRRRAARRRPPRRSGPPAKKAPAKKRGGARSAPPPSWAGSVATSETIPALIRSQRQMAASQRRDERGRHDRAGEQACRARRSRPARRSTSVGRDEGEGDAVAEHR